MNESNLEYLQDQVKFTGFGDELSNKIADGVKTGEEKFKIEFSKAFDKDSVEVELNFSKSKESDMYFFNKYNVQLQKEGKEGIKQTFYINKNNNITLREAYNLMSGRSVYKKLSTKTGDEYMAWLKVDFKDTDTSGNYKVRPYNENYGFNLNVELNQHPIKELEREDHKRDLLESLQKGNLALITYLKGDQEEKRYISADVQFKSINFYDLEKQPLGRKKANKQEEAEGVEVQDVSNGNNIGNTAPVLDNGAVEENVGGQAAGRSNRIVTGTEEAEDPDVPEKKRARKGKTPSV
ncbi:hypothetical protein [Pedobacter sp.]|uniref:hypothetical protein n=1 Tax=Pedobacter sp. TaxID=1411316 RepID=UPI00396CCE79